MVSELLIENYENPTIFKYQRNYLLLEVMLNNLKIIYESLVKNELKRKLGEISSKTGKSYEDKVSFYILTRFNKLFNTKSKILNFYFNGIEDLDIFDDTGTLISIQIKKRKHTWTKRDPALLKFLENCINRFKLIIDTGKNIQLKFYFFTNITGNFLEDWNRLHKYKPDELLKKLPVKIRILLENKNFLNDEIENIFSNINFFTSQRSSFLNPYINNDLYNKFRKFKEYYNPGENVEFHKFHDEIFYEKRLLNSRLYEPAYEKDVIVSNMLEVELLKDNIYYAEVKKGTLKNEIQNELKSIKTRISFLLKNKKIFCFHNFDKKNPLTQFIKEGTNIETIYVGDLDINDKIQLLNDWLYNYLNYIGLRYYSRKHKRYFYFYSLNRNKYINWNDAKSKKIKEWRVIKRTENFYENLGAEINFKGYEDKFYIVIKPRLFFSINGRMLLEPRIMREIERKYRKKFMKNDFLRRRLYVLVSYIKQDMKEYQLKISDFINNSIKLYKRTKERTFFDKDLVKFKSLIKLEANFKPNIESLQTSGKLISLGE